MTETSWAMLRDLLVDRYEEFRRRLARRLGSAELASETLHEAWLRLARMGSAGQVSSPEDYVFRVALNVAADRRQAESRLLSISQIEAIRHLDDDELDPQRIAEARSEVSALKEALGELPPRCRSIFIAARVEEIAHRDIAERWGISIRMVERDLKLAFDYFEARLGKKAIRRVGSRLPEMSTLQMSSPEKPSPSSQSKGGPGSDD